MNLIDRVKNILTTPKTEWLVIDTESATPPSLLTSYVLPLALVSAIAAFIGYGFVGVNYFGVHIGGVSWGLYQGIISLLAAVVSFYIATYTIDALAPSFSSEKNINKSAQLVAYASTASYVAGIFAILPAIAFLAIVGGLYAVYLFYIGLPILKKTPEDKTIGYMIVSALIIIVVNIVVGTILLRIVYAVAGNPYASSVNVNSLLGN